MIEWVPTERAAVATVQVAVPPRVQSPIQTPPSETETRPVAGVPSPVVTMGEYFMDNGEDALIMTTDPLESPPMRVRLEQRRDEVEAGWPDLLSAWRLTPTEAQAPGGERLADVQLRVRGALEHRLADQLFVELGFNYERVSELLGGPFDNAESLNLFADPNRYLPGGTAAAPQSTLNPNAGRLLIDAQWKNDDGRTGNDVARASVAWQASKGSGPTRAAPTTT